MNLKGLIKLTICLSAVILVLAAGSVADAGTAKDYRDKAIEMGDWLVNNQAAWTTDAQYKFYKTASNILALALLYEETGNSSYLTAAQNAADFVTTNLQLMDETTSEGWTYHGASGMDFTPETWDDAYGLIMASVYGAGVEQYANGWGLGQYALALKKLNELTGSYSSNLDAIKHWYETYTHGSPETNYGDGVTDLIYKRMSGYNDRVAYPMQHGVIPPNNVYHTYGDNPYPFKLWGYCQGKSISALLILGSATIATELGDWLVDPNYGWNTTYGVFNSFYDFDIDQPNWNQNTGSDYGVQDGTDRDILVGLLELYHSNPTGPNALTYKQRSIDAMDYILTTPGWWNNNDINNPYYGIVASVMLWDVTGNYTYLGNARAKGDEYLALTSGDYGWGNGSIIIRLLKAAGAFPDEVWVDDDYCDGCGNDGHTWGYDAFDNIQDGIDAVSGSIVHVAAGTYNEEIYIDKSLTLSGAGRDVTTIDSQGSGVTIELVANGITVEGFTITGATSGAGRGIDNHDTGGRIDVTIKDNRIEGNSGCGMYINPGVLTCDNIEIRGNIFEDNGAVGGQGGLYLTGGTGIQYTNVVVADNQFINNTSQGAGVELCDNAIITGNTVTGTLPGGAQDGVGMFLSFGVGGYIYDNTANNNAREGIMLWETDGATVCNNVCYDNNGAGLRIAAWSGLAKDNIVTGNDFTNNVRGIELLSWGQNHVYGNELHQNNIAGNLNYGVYNDNSSCVDASTNWWGDASGPGGEGVGSGDDVSTNVDYTPWIHDGTDQSGDPGYQPDLSYLHVDDNSPQTGTTFRIQEGVDMVTGSTVKVMNGSYGADPVTGKGVYITKDGLSLIGESETGTIIDGAIGGVGSSGSYWPKGIHVQANNVTVQNFTVQGFTGDLVNTGGYGVLHRDYDHDTEEEGWIFYDGCTVDNVTVQNCYSVVYALCFTHLTVLNCNLNNNFSDGMFIARGSDYATIHDNIVTNSGDHGIWVGNCWMSLRPSHNATIYNNTVNGAREGGITFDGSNTAVIHHNSITNAAGDGWSVGALNLKDGPTNVEAYSNTIFNNSGTWGGYNGTGHGVGIDGAASGINLHHNSIYGNSGLGVYNGSTKGLAGTWNQRLNEDANPPNPNHLISLGGKGGPKAFILAEYNYWGSVDGPEDLVGTDEAKLDECYDVSTMKNEVAEISGTLGNGASEDVDYCPWLGGDAGFDAEIYAGCNDPCDDFCLDFKLTGTNVRFFHFEYPLPACIDLVSSSGTHGDLVVWETVMFGDVLHIDGSFDPNFNGANVKIGEICFTHDGTCPNTVQTLTCTFDEVLDGDGNLVDVSPGLAIINLDNTVPDKTHPTGDILPCYSAPDDPDWTCWNLNFYKGTEEWQCKLLQATIRIYEASGCGSGDLIFTNHFFTTPIPGDFSICYPETQAGRDSIWTAIYGTATPPFNNIYDGTYYVRITVKDSCCNEADNCDAFTFCTDTYTENYMTCLDAKPAHNHICLEWNFNFDATNAVKLQILRSPYRAGNYPEYAASDPVPDSANDPNWYVLYEGTDTYPCDQTTWFNDDGTGCVTGIGSSNFADKEGDGDDFPTDDDARDIYWYAGFTLDAAGNWSAPNMTLGTGTDRATSYWLGDVTNDMGLTAPDGYVFGAAGDVDRLSSAYGTTPPDPGWDNTVDYGPETQEHGIGRGIPMPDDVINYKDLKPFSFNYNIVGPSGDCDNWPLPPETQPRKLEMDVDEIAAVWLEQVESTHPEGITFALMLTNPGDATHLFHSRISYNTDILSLVQVRRGEVGISEGFAEFFRAPITGKGLMDVDLAVLGPDGYLIGSGAVAYLDFNYEVSDMATLVRLEEAILYDGEGNEIELSPTGVQVKSQGEAIPTEFALHQNHPNPFNPTTIIKYDLPQASYVKLVVYNVRGQKVATLVDGMVQAGRQQVVWNAKDISSGIYFYKITAGNFTEMNKMILLK